MNTGTTITWLMPNQSLSRMELITQKAELLKSGQATTYEIGKDLKLTNRQIDFCQYYTTTEFYGNGARAYAKAYGLNYDDKNQRNRCASGANNNLSNLAILTMCDILLDGEGFNDAFFDKQLMFVATQNYDLKAKMLAIKTYAELKNRIKKTVEITHNSSFDYTQLPSQDLALLIQLAEKARLGNG